MTAAPYPPATSPHELMMRLDRANLPYWLDPLYDAGRTLLVVSHGPEWVCVKEGNDALPYWIRWADLGPVAVVEK